MVKHVILWKLKSELSESEKEKVKKEAKEALEGLKGKIDGLIDIKVNINRLPSSNCDMMLDSSFTDAEALRGYAVHPVHCAAADTYVRPFTEVRTCLDFID